MKKKQIVQLGVTLGLVAAVGVGGTLAILSAKSNVVTNTFAAGAGIDEDKNITLFEHIPESNATAKDDQVDNVYKDGTSTADKQNIAKVGVSYSNLEPNMTLSKDPAVQISKDTADCYLFVKVDRSAFVEQVGADNVDMDGIFKAVDGSTSQYSATNWHLLDSTTNIYYYEEGNKKVIDTSENAFVSEPLFKEIKLGMNADLYDENGSNALTEEDEIEIKAFIVQATEAGNWDEAVTMAKNPATWGEQ